MKIIIFGLGAIGQRQATLLLRHHDHELFAFRTHQGHQDCRLPIREISTWSQFDHLKPDIAFITNPTALHIVTAIQCAERDCSLFIEKPLGSTTDQLEELIGILRLRGLSAYVAYNLRFHPIITELKKYADHHDLLHLRVQSTSYLPTWRTNQNHRDSYSSIAQMGGGVILDLSHEIDYVSYLTNGIDSIDGQFDRASDLTVDTEDVADLFIKSTSGIANIHINFMAHRRERRICADFKDFTIDADLISGSLKTYRKEQLIAAKDYDIDIDFTYRRQLTYFFNHLESGMMNNIHEASALFRKIVDFKERRNAG